MTKLEVRIRYLINDLWIEPGLLGWGHRLDIDGEAIEIRFPDSPDDFTAREWETGLEPTPSAFPVTGVYEEPNWDSRTEAVRIVAISVVFGADLPADRPKNPFEGEYGAMLNLAYERGRTRAESTMQAFLEWLRALSRQPWLGLLADSPMQYGRGGVYYAESGEPIAGLGPTVSRTFTSSRSRIDASRLQLVMNGVESGQEVPPSQALLADAWHLTEGTDRPDSKRAVILAAIACEIRVQEHLRAAANQLNGAMLHLLLSKGSSVHYLYVDLMQAVCGISLDKADPDLWKHVLDLSANRNSLVHEGVPSPKRPLRRGAPDIAQRVFDWLASLEMSVHNNGTELIEPTAQ